MFKNQKENKWIKPTPKNYGFGCCDCGLVHDLDFKVLNGRVLFRARRNFKDTVLLRIKMVKEKAGRWL